MFAIFSLRRPDILPVGKVSFSGSLAVSLNNLLCSGDLGVQRGLVRWFLSLHSPSHNYSISPEKVGGQSTAKKASTKKQKGKAEAVTTPPNEDELPTFGTSQAEASTSDLQDASVPDISSVLPATSEDGEPGGSGMSTIPPPFTPSIKKTLDKPAVDAGSEPVPLPSGIDVAMLKSRLDGKKKIKYAFDSSTDT
jgi:DNA-3-methyladenine glycosylase II